jgi:CRISPR/Cas system-associated exonuclease Cas4 (RecB family)
VTAPTTADLLLKWAEKNTAARKRGLSWSAIGGCRRRAGYILAGTAPSNPGESVVAAVGSAVHDKVAEAAREVCPDDLIEHRVEFGGIAGTLDRYRPDDTTCVDTKTTSSRWLEHIRLHGPEHNHIWQLSGYAAGLRKQGHEVTHVELHYLARDTGEEWVYRQLFDVRDVRDALQWVKAVQDVPVEMLPRDFLPDSGYCKHCPFLDTCWPGADTSRRMEVLFTDDPDADKWASELWDVRQQIKALEERKTRATGALAALRPDAGKGRVHTGSHTLDFRTKGIYFVAGGDEQPAVGFHEGDAA